MALFSMTSLVHTILASSMPELLQLLASWEVQWHTSLVSALIIATGFLHLCS